LVLAPFLRDGSDFYLFSQLFVDAFVSGFHDLLNLLVKNLEDLAYFFERKNVTDQGCQPESSG